MRRVEKMLKALTTEDLRQWAGTKIFNRGKSYLENVDGLCRTDDGALAAWVYGSDEYATSVGLDPDGELEYLCTCPYEDGPCIAGRPEERAQAQRRLMQVLDSLSAPVPLV